MAALPPLTGQVRCTRLTSQKLTWY